jgi:hypothetical protein
MDSRRQLAIVAVAAIAKHVPSSEPLCCRGFFVEIGD